MAFPTKFNCKYRVVAGFLASILILMLCLSPGDLLAENIAPGELLVSTPRYKPSPSIKFLEGTYSYDVSWQGIPAAEATIQVKREAENYRLIAEARTAKGIDIFYKLRYRAEGLLKAIDFSPIKSIFEKREGKRFSNTQITFGNRGEIESVTWKVGKQPKVVKFTSKNHTLEPFSAAYLARSLDWEVGDSKQFDTYNGDSRYIITFKCEEEIIMPINGVDRKVWILTPDSKNLTKPKAKKKVRKAWVYITADDAREIVQIKSQAFIGNVYTKLKRFDPLVTSESKAELKSVIWDF